MTGPRGDVELAKASRASAGEACARFTVDFHPIAMAQDTAPRTRSLCRLISVVERRSTWQASRSWRIDPFRHVSAESQ